jgi:hypothetical protein
MKEGCGPWTVVSWRFDLVHAHFELQIRLRTIRFDIF